MNGRQNSLLILPFWNENVKRLVIGRRQKIFPPINGKQTSTCLEIRLWLPLRCSWPSRLKMASNDCNSLRKTLGIKIMTFLPALKNVKSPLHEVKRTCLQRHSALACFRETWVRVVTKAIPPFTTLILKLVLARQDIFPVFHIAVLGKAGFPPFFPQELQKTSVRSKNTAASVDHVSH